MTIFMLGPDQEAQLRERFETARKEPIPLATVRALAVPDKPVIALADRQEEHTRPESEHVLLPNGFRCAISVEEQPLGLCAHISLSSPRPGRLPIPQALQLCAEAIGLTGDPLRIWGEEFLIDGKPGGLALNGLWRIT